MKLTTKIIFGIILSIFVISLIIIIGFSFTDRKKSSYSNIELPQDKITGVELTAFNTIVIDEISYESKGHKYYSIENSIVNIDRLPEKDNSDSLFLPESLKDYAIIKTSADTLKIILDINGLKDKYSDTKSNTISGINMRFCISKIDIINNLQDLSIIIKNIETDSINVCSQGKVFIDSCKMQFICPLIENYFRGGFYITNCDIKTVNLDLDILQDWNIEKCNIEEQNITGSRIHYMTHLCNEPTNINWIPKTNEAELYIRIPGDTIQVSIQ